MHILVENLITCQKLVTAHVCHLKKSQLKLLFVVLYLSFTGNVLRGNGLQILNLTSTENVLIEAQNVPALSVSNNMLVDNNGSCTLWLSADGGESFSS